MYEKLTKCSNFTWYLPKKLTKYRDIGTVSKKNISDRPFWRDFWGTKMLKYPNFPGLCHHWGEFTQLTLQPRSPSWWQGDSTFAWNMPEFYITFGRKIFFWDFSFFWGGGNPLSGAGPQAHHQLNPALSRSQTQSYWSHVNLNEFYRYIFENWICKKIYWVSYLGGGRGATMHSL